MKLSIALLASLLALALVSLDGCDAGRLGRRGQRGLRRRGVAEADLAKQWKRHHGGRRGGRLGKAWYGPVESEAECTEEGRPDKVWYRFAKPVDTLCEEVSNFRFSIL